MNGIELIKTRYNDKKEITVQGRDLHSFLEVKTAYKDWFPRMTEYGFEEGTDYNSFIESVGAQNRARTYDQLNHNLSIDMAKEIAMIQRSEKGKLARQYFLEIERRWNSPEMVMKRALEYANEQVLKLESKIEEQKPKVLLAESIENSNDLILIRELANILNQNGVKIGQNRLFERLRDMGYLVKGGSSRNSPTQRSMDLGLFKIVEGTYNGSNEIKLTKTTKVTGKGQKYFVNKFLKEVKG
jgi:anti-repressor protein